MENQTHSGTRPTIRFNLLGPLSSTYDGQRVELGGAKQQMVLALLLLDANRVVSTDRLSQWVWPEVDDDHLGDGRRNAGTLQVYVSNLRRIFGSLGDEANTLVVTRKPGYVINLDPYQLDTLEFDSLRAGAAAAAGKGDLDSARMQYRRALGLWTGEPLAGLPVDAIESGPITHLEEQRLGTLEALGEVELRLGRHSELLADLHEWVSANPLNEVMRAQLILALYRCGRQADALAAYNEGRRLLIDQLGIDPSRMLRELEARILDQDPALDHLAVPPISRAATNFDAAGSTQLRSSLLASNAWVELDGRRFPLDTHLLTLGRLDDRDIVLADDRVSRHHAELRRTGANYRLVDVGSANGTLVNGEPADGSELSDGDRIRLGDTELVFHTEPGG
ncbi:MAG: BTAD domain-containing putative transcriptional regulator [Microthrixaceae bacterium]